jgi:ribosomal-protein-alanine N-acetyltransferase
MVGEALRDLIIDDMKTSDIDDVLKIEVGSFTVPWSETLFHNEIQKTGSMSKVARLSERVVGYICVNQILDEGHILDIAVHHTFRRLGIAFFMVDQIIADLRVNNCRKIFLEVRASNKIALSMYEKFNFSVLGIRKNYYTSPVEDGVLMALSLEG